MIKDIKNSFVVLNKKNKLNYFVLLIGIIIGALLEIFSIYLIYKLIVFITNKTFLDQDTNEILLFDNNFLYWNYSTDISIFLVLIIIFFSVKMIYFFLLYYGKYYFVNNLAVNLSSLILKQYLQKNNSFYIYNNSSTLIRNVQNEVSQFALGVLQPLLILFSEIFMLIGISVFLILSNPSVVVGCFIILFFLSMIYFLSIKRILSFYGLERQRFTDRVLNSLIEIFNGLRTIKIFNAENYFFKNFYLNARGLAKSNIILGALSHVPKFALEFIVVLFVVLYFIYLNQNNSSDLAFDTLALFAVASFKLIPSISRVLHSLQIIRFNVPSLNIILKEKKHKGGNGIRELKFNFTPYIFKKEILFKNVKFKHSSKNKIILKNLNLKIKKGNKICIIGDSGSGKTTLINLIMGFLNPTSGNILIDGKKLDKIKYQWMKIIGFVPQKLFLLNDNIFKNVAFGTEEKKINKGKVFESLKLADLSNFKQGYKNIFKNKLGEQGSKISGGQMQRVSIARSIYRDTQLYIFDEATNSLDYNTEKKVLHTIKKIAREKTVIIISHRVETLKFCDKVYRIKNSRLEEIK